MERFFRDVRIALRGFGRARTFAIVVTLVLGVGIGMATAIATLVQGVLLRELPVREPERLMLLRLSRQADSPLPAVLKELEAFQKDSRTTRGVAGVVHWGAASGPLLDGDETLVFNRAIVSGNFFDVLGARPVLGRLLRPENEVASGNFALVLSYAMWRRQYGGDSTVIGRRLIEPFTERAYTIVGVAPPGLDYPSGVEYWIPTWAKEHLVVAVARLAPGATPSAVRAEFGAAMERMAPDRPITGASSTAFTQAVLGNVRPVLLAMMAAATLLLVIACVNVGNLLIMRASQREGEFAVRRALGASSSRMTLQLLIENVLLGLTGGVLGLCLAFVLLKGLVVLAPDQFPRMDVVRLAGPPVGAALVMTLLSVLLFGIAPALLAARATISNMLRLDARSGTESRSHRRSREWLVAAQVALALVMLAAAGLLTRSLARLQRIELGYKAERLAIIQLAPPITKYTSQGKLMAVGEDLLPRWRSVPGVSAVSPVLIPPFLGAGVWRWQFEAEGQSQADVEASQLIPVEVGGSEFFRTFEMPLLRGRGFSEVDREDAPKVVVVSQSIVNRYWPDKDPIGRRIRVTGDPSFLPSGSEWRTVVGVVGDPHFRSFREATPTLYLPWRQGYWQGIFALRTTGELQSVLPALRRELAAVDPQIKMWEAQSMDELLSGPLSTPRLSAFLMSVFGFTALLLAAIGLYGIMAAAVREQTHDIGVRMALGASPSHVRRQVLSNALGVASAGAVVGIAIALLASRLLTSLLFEVSPTDPMALLGACALLLSISLVAAYLPARHATTISPARALRVE